MIELRRNLSNEAIPGTWRPWDFAGGRRVILACPRCGEEASLGGHKIADDGAVTPSVVCPQHSCDYHEMIRLLDWTLADG